MSSCVGDGVREGKRLMQGKSTRVAWVCSRLCRWAHSGSATLTGRSRRHRGFGCDDQGEQKGCAAVMVHGHPCTSPNASPPAFSSWQAKWQVRLFLPTSTARARRHSLVRATLRPAPAPPLARPLVRPTDLGVRASRLRSLAPRCNTTNRRALHLIRLVEA